MILQRFSLLKLLEFSLISSRARQLVRSLNLTAEPIEVYIYDSEISISIHGNHWNMRFSFYGNQSFNENQIRRLPPPRFADVLINNEMYKLYKKEFEMKDWVDHLLSVFNCSTTNQYTVVLNFLKFSDVEGIWNAFKTCNNLNINRFVYKGNEEKIHKILMRNYTSLKFFEKTTLSLDDLLTINSSHAQFFYASFTEKMLNRFLKHWIKGSNPRLESALFSCSLEQNFELDLLLKGIDYKVVPSDRSYWIFDDDEGVGIEIKRRNGTFATLEIFANGKFVTIYMTVRYN
ncbi:hypothetical protein CRE_29304 [Caenorhabditis remanei]|uniref:Sdz-33 F-box domain-containing protein n=1 Tax=Caenorhabditis remanei TaxID=31234 RepID=E3MY04_CAERE|nr:hypothetical protein CRE_29304 [Caenorhabditis remanei]